MDCIKKNYKTLQHNIFNQIYLKQAKIYDVHTLLKKFVEILRV